MTSKAAFPFVLDAGRARRRPALDSAQTRLSLKSRPIPSKHCSHLASIGWFPATGRDCRSCCCSWSLGRRATQRSRDKRRQAYRSGSWLLKREGRGGSRGPLPWPIGAASVATIITLWRFAPSSSFFSRLLSVPRFFLYCLAASLRALLSVARAIHCRSEEIFPVGLSGGPLVSLLNTSSM